MNMRYTPSINELDGRKINHKALGEIGRMGFEKKPNFQTGMKMMR